MPGSLRRARHRCRVPDGGFGEPHRSAQRFIAGYEEYSQWTADCDGSRSDTHSLFAAVGVVSWSRSRRLSTPALIWSGDIRRWSRW